MITNPSPRTTDPESKYTHLNITPVLFIKGEVNPHNKLFINYIVQADFFFAGVFVLGGGGGCPRDRVIAGLGDNFPGQLPSECNCPGGGGHCPAGN